MSRHERIEAFQKAMDEARVWPTRDPVDQAELDRASAGAFPGGPLLKSGDWVLHPDHGRCLVRSIEKASVALIDKRCTAIELNLEATDFKPDSIESGKQRIFSMSPSCRTPR